MERFYLQFKLLLSIFVIFLGPKPKELSGSKRITLGKNTLSYFEMGNGKEICIFLHGWKLSKEMWRDIIPEFAKKYKVIALDLPGFGGSSRLSSNATLKDYALMFYLFVQKKNIEKFHLIGYSFGGKIAFLFASMFPNKVQKMVICSASLGSKKGVISKFVALFSNTYKNTHTRISREVIRGIQKTTLLLYGKFDFIVPVWEGEEIAAAIKNSKLVVFSHSLHMAYTEERQKFIKEIINFLA